jgi:hypothetical protein
MSFFGTINNHLREFYASPEAAARQIEMICWMEEI